MADIYNPMQESLRTIEAFGQGGLQRGLQAGQFAQVRQADADRTLMAQKRKDYDMAARSGDLNTVKEVAMRYGDFNAVKGIDDMIKEQASAAQAQKVQGIMAGVPSYTETAMPRQGPAPSFLRAGAEPEYRGLNQEMLVRTPISPYQRGLAGIGAVTEQGLAVPKDVLESIEKLKPEKVEKEKPEADRWKVIKVDKKTSPTGYAYQDLNEPQNIRPNAPAPKDESGIWGRANQNSYLSLKRAFDGDDVVKQATRTLQAVPYLSKAYEQYKKTGEAGVLDQALIVNQGKISDPDSAVMIGEYLINNGLQSLWQKAEGNVAKLINSSAGLSPEYREALYEAVMYALENKKVAYDQRVDSARADAADFGVPEERIKKAFPYSDERFKTSAGKAGGSKFDKFMK